MKQGGNQPGFGIAQPQAFLEKGQQHKDRGDDPVYAAVAGGHQKRRGLIADARSRKLFKSRQGRQSLFLSSLIPCSVVPWPSDLRDRQNFGPLVEFIRRRLHQSETLGRAEPVSRRASSPFYAYTPFAPILRQSGEGYESRFHRK